MITDLTECNDYLKKHPAPPCTRCLCQHRNMHPVSIKGQWLYLCDSCRGVYGLLDRFELEAKQAFREKARKEKKARKARPKDMSKSAQLEALLKSRVSFSEFLDRFNSI